MNKTSKLFFVVAMFVLAACGQSDTEDGTTPDDIKEVEDVVDVSKETE